MHPKSALSTLSLFFAALVLSGCGLLGGNPTQGIGIMTKNCKQDPNAPQGVLRCLAGSELTIAPYVPVWGNEAGDCYGPYTSTPPSCSDPANYSMDYTHGSVGSFGSNGDQPLVTPEDGPLVVNNAMAPAFWNLYWVVPWPCGYNTDPNNGPVFLGEAYYDTDFYNGYGWKMEVEGAVLNIPTPNYYSAGLSAELDCFVSGPWISPASTRFAILGNLPNSLTLTSRAPLTTQNGMPLLYVYDKAGSVVVTETATDVSSDGTEATFPFPSSLPQSGYSLALVNQTGRGVGFAPAGDNLLSIASSQTIAGNPFGAAAGGLTTTTSTVIREGPRWVGPITSTTYSAFPVVSLYASGQVLIGSVPVNVGANPTAVATYAGPSVESKDTVGSEQITTTISGTTRAVVANSGSNSISVLNLVNNSLVFNVTVGNHPVALAVSSNGSTAYVANYTDSTVTQVNLTTGTATTTVAVGGKPTSVALTSAGTLWVGGGGFLTEINTGTMSVAATEPVTGKSIIALGFSNSVNQLVATSVDTSGNVFAEEVSPSTFHAGGVYTPLASHTVSSLGTRLNHVTGAQVQAFTGTLTGTSTISSNQVGAPPLVVQDGWAVVTATPTGFTITDITGHIALISEKTPSPVTAIAVDSNLNVAYLVMPDSNTLLTVPLPGTN
jgi:YVTN family beta-propeller protein